MVHYDVNGNTMVSLLCDIYQFDGYLKSVNPPFTDDEVRRAKKPFYDTINASKNNFTKTGEYSKSYNTFRQDGRPLNCDVFDGG